MGKNFSFQDTSADANMCTPTLAYCKNMALGLLLFGSVACTSDDKNSVNETVILTPSNQYLNYLTQRGISYAAEQARDHRDLELGEFHFFSLQIDNTSRYKAAASSTGLVTPGQRPTDAWYALLSVGNAVELARRIAWLETDGRIDPHRDYAKLKIVFPNKLPIGFALDPAQRKLIQLPKIERHNNSIVLIAWFLTSKSKEPVRWKIRALSNNTITFDIATAENLAKPGEKASIRARRYIKAKNLNDRLWALQTLGESGDISVLKPITVALEDGNGEIREAAATALAMLGDSSSIEKIKTAAKKESEQLLRSHYVQVLGWFGGSAVTALIELAASEAVIDVRLNIVHVLSTIDTLASRSALAKIAANDSDPAIRKLAISYVQTTHLPMD